MLHSFDETLVVEIEGQLWVRDRHGNIACEAFTKDVRTTEEMLNAGYILVPYRFEGKEIFVEVSADDA